MPTDNIKMLDFQYYPNFEDILDHPMTKRLTRNMAMSWAAHIRTAQRIQLE
jgi:hypothetical protein